MQCEKSRFDLVAIVAIAMAAGGCDPTLPGSGSGPASQVVVTSEIRECPHTWEWEAPRNQESPATIEQEIASVTRGGHHVPEYNDCQKFIVKEAGQAVYSAGQFAIFAVQDRGLIDMLNDRVRVAAAVIFAEQAYAPLGIERNFNCLVLQAGGEDWNAWMYPPNDGIADCSGEFPERGGHPLTLEGPISPLQAEESHYAQLARWGYDIDREWQYMTVTCGEAVCHVGPTGFAVASPPTLNTASATDMERRVHEVATWHDQQFLAALSTGTSSLRPTEVWGTVIPDPGLGDLNALADFRDEWVTVAEVTLSADHPAYAAKGFRMTASGDVRNLVQSCVIEETTNSRGDVTRSRCPDLPEEFLPGGKCDVTDDVSTGERWRSRHIAVDGEIKYFCVKRYPLTVPGLEVPAAARWRWRADDELLWFRCMRGCCDEQV